MVDFNLNLGEIIVPTLIILFIMTNDKAKKFINDFIETLDEWIN